MKRSRINLIYDEWGDFPDTLPVIIPIVGEGGEIIVASFPDKPNPWYRLLRRIKSEKKNKPDKP